MDFRSVLIIGGSGFIGGHLLAKLAGTDWRVIVVTRRYEKARHLLELPSVDDLVEADIHDEATLHRLMQGNTAVINLVGILHSHPGSPYGPDFAKVHVELPRKVAAACAANGVHRLLHMSALGAAADAPSMYLRSKADGERAAMSQPSVGVTIFRPSVVFGDGDHFLNMFAALEKFLPVMLLASADAKFQPVYVEDVAQAFVHALSNDRTIGKTYELAGPTVYTLRELVKLAGVCSGHSRPVIGLPEPLARLQAMLMEHMPGEPLMTRDNLDSMKIENVASVAAEPIDPELGITPTTLESVAPYYLTGQRPPHTGVDATHTAARH
ncbi:complex I NDUFA9 subunit family protein [Noviherbaspirillum cavernae]|uniref:Complex I NDUFA9 subunit family protein n=1 Tax=Noviherbaspirillum cavernae TaxID=2320862 RepID=A0A418WXK7_9BURK|nr:complex I NDUFA9 subunit family protein [Noviherbaspirillum cavernae]RJG04931.1 complex I NDUFA9 subunit family protein [Noviherbaspirillum cavernae]